MRIRARNLVRQATRKREAGDLIGADRARARARSVLGDRSERVGTCRTTAMTLACKCGPKRVMVGCGQRWLCSTCRARFYQTVRRTALAAWRSTWAKHRARWERVGRPRGAQWRYYFLRLSTKHTGDVAADRETIVKAWSSTRSWLAGVLGAEHPYYREWRERVDRDTGEVTWVLSESVSFPYQLTWETTPGEDGQGHVHAHVIVLWPWFDWQRLHSKWVRATSGQSNHVRIESVRSGYVDGKQTRKRDGEHAAAADAVLAVADYVAKYATKGVDVEAFDGDLAGRILVAFYMKRVVSASRGFMRRDPCRCPECRCTFDVRERPVAAARSFEREIRLATVSPRASPVAWLYSCGLMPPALCKLPQPLT